MAPRKKSEQNRHFARALKELRARKGWTQADLAGQLEVTTAAVGNWETEANGVTVRRLRILADKVGLPIDYFRPESPAFRGRAAAPVASERPRRVPVVTWEQAEQARDLAELNRPGGERMETDCKDPNCFVLVVEGDSMEPLALAGDLVVIAPGSEPRNGDLVVCRLKDDRMLFRRYQRRGPEGRTIRLESANPSYQPMEFAAREIACVYPAFELKRKLRK